MTRRIRSDMLIGNSNDEKPLAHWTYNGMFFFEDDTGRLFQLRRGSWDEIKGSGGSIDAGDVTSGTFADARISQSSVTQHEAAIDHDALTNFVTAEHINWSVTGAEDINADRITSAAVTQHEGALSITESQITDLGNYAIKDQAQTISGSWTFSTDLAVADKIVHAGDTNTAIRFPAADTVTIETAGGERVRVDSNGNVGIGTTSPPELLTVADTSDGAGNDVPTITIRDQYNGAWTAGASMGRLDFDSEDASGSGAGVKSRIEMVSGNPFGSQTELVFSTDGGSGLAEGLRITENQEVELNGANFVDETQQLQNTLDDSSPRFLDLDFPNISTAEPTVRMFRVADTTSGCRFDIYNGDGTGNLAHRFQTKALNSFVQLEGGNFGIGTNAPDEKLDVNGNVQADQYLIKKNIHALTDVTTTGQTRTIDVANGPVQTLRTTQDFTLNATGPSGQMATIIFYIHNDSGGTRLITKGSNLFGSASGGLAGYTAIHRVFWDGANGIIDLITQNTGDLRP